MWTTIIITILVVLWIVAKITEPSPPPRGPLLKPWPPEDPKP